MTHNDEKKGVFYTVGEEIFNSVSHGIGVLLSVAALVLLILFAVLYGDGYALAGAIVYGISLILLYTMSMVYHIVSHPKAKKVLRIFDHGSIFVLIAGTYTPYLLVCFENPMRWIFFGAMWGVALLGIILNAINLEKFKVFSMICYIGMGWAMIFSMETVIKAVALTGVILLLAGGIVYSLGIIFYKLKKYRYMHSIWHLFVLGGSICHYLSILLYVLK